MCDSLSPTLHSHLSLSYRLSPRLQMAGDDIDNLNFDNLEAVAHLTSSERYQSITAAVRKAAEEDASGGAATAWAGPSEEDPTYK